VRKLFLRLILIIGSLASTASLAQAPLWQIDNLAANRSQVGSHGKAYFAANAQALRALLQNTPHELSGDNSYIISLPMPDGSLSRFSLVESPIMADALAARYPEIKTYKVFGIDDPAASGRVDITPRGFHAMLHTAQGRVTIDPEAGLYRAQWRKGGGGNNEFQCRTGELGADETSPSSATMSTTSGTIANRVSNSFLVYRLALSATVEYVTAVGGGLSGAHAEIVTAINRVTEIYERDLGIRFQLVGNNDSLIELDQTRPLPSLPGLTLPNLSNGNLGFLLNQNQVWIDTILGNGDQEAGRGLYDIGHIFSTDGDAGAWLESTCDDPNKAKGATGTSLDERVGDAFYIDYVAHEIGHQFGAEHTFNGLTNFCLTGREGAWAVEPGSGSTIMRKIFSSIVMRLFTAKVFYRFITLPRPGEGRPVVPRSVPTILTNQSPLPAPIALFRLARLSCCQAVAAMQMRVIRSATSGIRPILAPRQHRQPWEMTWAIILCFAVMFLSQAGIGISQPSEPRSVGRPIRAKPYPVPREA